MSKDVLVSKSGLSFHGECTIVRASLIGETELPDDAVKVEPDTQGRLLVAHSESGHHHYVDGGGPATLYTTSNPLIKYLDVHSDTYALLKHAKTEGLRHETQGLEKGLHRINIQRESTPEGWRAVQD